MTEDPPQPPPSALNDALERNFADIQAHYARGVGGIVRDLADVRMSRSGLPARVVNAVNRARFGDGTRADEGIAEAKAFFGEVGVPFRWLVGPSSPPDLAARLTAAGIPKISDTPGMALDIERMNDEPLQLPGPRGPRGGRGGRAGGLAGRFACVGRLRRRDLSAPGPPPIARWAGVPTPRSTTSWRGSTAARSACRRCST